MPLVGDRRPKVLAAGEAVTGVAPGLGRGESEARAGHIGAATIGGESVGDCREKVATVAAVGAVAVVVAAAATGERSRSSGTRPVAQPRVS